MLLKKSALALCSCSNIQSAWTLPASISSPCNTHSPLLSRRSCSSNSVQLKSNRRSLEWPNLRRYATASHPDHRHPRPRYKRDGSQRESHDHTNWPTAQDPTPYEIFDQQKSAPYSKAKFYELVKLYHPDRHHHTAHQGLAHATKLERYRLVIAANHILCDPAKRRAYDLYGAGWGGKDDMHNDYRAAERSWRQQPGSAANNATWEDWEQWYQQRDGKKQEPLYMSNGGFVVVIVMFVLIGGWGQATRAGSHSLYIVEMEDKKQNHISAEMKKRQNESSMLTREGRVESFLRQREGWGYESAGVGHTPREPQEPDR